jgi:membrane-associated phospholipid phosphatase
MTNFKKDVTRQIELISLEVLLVAFLFICSLFVFALLAHEVMYENEKTFDSSVFNFFALHTNSSAIRVMTVFTFFGNIQFLIPAYFVLIAYLLIKKRYKLSIDIAIIAISSSALMFGLKLFFHRTRPPLPFIQSFTTYSFPSGHAISSFIFCSILIYLMWHINLPRSWKWFLSGLLLLFSLTIGLSRIILHKHYATDVIAGFCLGIVWVILSFWLLKRIRFSFSAKRKKVI